MPQRISRCRVSGSTNLVPVLSLGEQALTGVFPRSADENVSVGPLDLMWCPESGLLQIAHVYDADEMYGDNYGYRSGLNQSMVRHLSQKTAHLERFASVSPGNVVLDIGSNDATLLKSYSIQSLIRCLIPGFDGAILSLEWKDALWAKFFTAAPQRQRQSVERYNIVKRA